MNNRYFAGIGSRETPAEICAEMTQISKFLCDNGFTLRSGGARGADQAFESGATSKEIFLPWKQYEHNDSHFTEPSEQAIKLSRLLFPHFRGVTRETRLLLSRNVHQITGPELDVSPRSEFVVCWTRNGKSVGGTGYTIKIARHFDIPIFNLFNPNERIKMFRYFDDYIASVGTFGC